ncbi:protein translocase subunit SecD [Sphingosinicella soli]|uniref:Protein translocase subunit SecD n=1 Tax=Sphingosinicella soli TaxID=333708 RepID=A0A7W7B471_9SPHN|nr:protein translocase subunit SecD [Sphingosinicella soli]MBB4632760.1 preprotein translocase subunit SecD [Sphingosinicella soli]
MLEFSKVKIWSIIAVLVAGVIFSLPNFFSEKQVDAWPDWAPSARMNLGLDLRGGSHILLEANADTLARANLDKMEDDALSELRRAEGGAITVGDVSNRGGRVSFLVRNVDEVDRAVDLLRNLSLPIGVTGQRSFNVEVADGNRIVLTQTSAGRVQAMNSAMTQAVEVIRRRIDELGTREPTIIRQGAERIVVQVPGLQDPSALKELLGKTAQLEFKLVDFDADPSDIAAGRAPAGSQILPMSDTGQPIAVKRRAIITGDQLIDAQQTLQQGQWVVSFRFDSTGSRRFARVTQENVGKPFAIVLDNRVISAPNINEPILGGSGVISGSFNAESSNELAILLRSGKLPVELKVVEERTVGPDLGADSIRSGTIASIIAVAAVVGFMLITYGRFGFYANIALVLNVFLIIAVMSLMGATLTLPGIAGFVLTIGATVDANVLINERIREELRKGVRVRQAIENGYKMASGTIWDANITNVIAAVIMMWLGSGPIKGFAVVLTIGIITSVFTAVTVTRLMVVLWLRRARPASITI